MKSPIDKDYLNKFEEQKKKSRISKKFQLIGLMIAELLDDGAHKSLYIKLSKEYDSEKLLILAKDVASRKHIENKGGYFMKILHDNNQCQKKVLS